MATEAQKKTVTKIIDEMEDEIVQTISELVRIRSVNPGYPGVDVERELGGETKANNYLNPRYRKYRHRALVHPRVSPRGPGRGLAGPAHLLA